MRLARIALSNRKVLDSDSVLSCRSTAMALPQDKKSLDMVDEKRSQDEEKAGYDVTVSVADSVEGDEALKLVGRERTAEFSEEYNRKLRRKLVRVSRRSCELNADG